MISLALETNGKGWIGFIVELPGAYVRGRTREEAIGKAPAETAAYGRWLGESIEAEPVRIVQVVESQAAVHDGDTAILLEADRGNVSLEQFYRFAGLAWHSGQCFSALCRQAEHKNWIDPARTGYTFYGEIPNTILHMCDHVNQCQLYYLSRLELQTVEADYFALRHNALWELAMFYTTQSEDRVYEQESELWTWKKVLRRLIWHDRIHGKAIVRMLERQREQGLVHIYHDPFRFEISGSD